MVSKIDSALIAGKTKVNAAMNKFFSKKRKGLDGIIIAIGLILIAVIIVLVFKSETQTSVESAMEATTNKINDFTSEITGAGGTN